MMTCTRFRDSLDAYIDRELAAGAMAAADAHRATCAGCDRLAARALQMKAAVKHAVDSTAVPPGLERRVRSSLTPGWWMPRVWLPAAAALVVIGLLLPTLTHRRMESDAANAMDRLALRLEDSSEVELHGTLLCRDCELERRYGIKAPCKTIGHHGAIATTDGRIWNLVEQKAAADLIHNESLLGRQIVVRGRLFRGARALVIESYELQGPAAS